MKKGRNDTLGESSKSSKKQSTSRKVSEKATDEQKRQGQTRNYKRSLPQKNENEEEVKDEGYSNNWDQSESAYLVKHDDLCIAFLPGDTVPYLEHTIPSTVYSANPPYPTNNPVRRSSPVKTPAFRPFEDDMMSLEPSVLYSDPNMNYGAKRPFNKAFTNDETTGEMQPPSSKCRIDPNTIYALNMNGHFAQRKLPELERLSTLEEQQHRQKIELANASLASKNFYKACRLFHEAFEMISFEDFTRPLDDVQSEAAINHVYALLGNKSDDVALKKCDWIIQKVSKVDYRIMALYLQGYLHEKNGSDKALGCYRGASKLAVEQFENKMLREIMENVRNDDNTRMPSILNFQSGSSKNIVEPSYPMPVVAPFFNPQSFPLQLHSRTEPLPQMQQQLQFEENEPQQETIIPREISDVDANRTILHELSKTFSSDFLLPNINPGEGVASQRGNAEISLFAQSSLELKQPQDHLENSLTGFIPTVSELPTSDHMGELFQNPYRILNAVSNLSCPSENTNTLSTAPTLDTLFSSEPGSPLNVKSVDGDIITCRSVEEFLKNLDMNHLLAVMKANEVLVEDLRQIDLEKDVKLPVGSLTTEQKQLFDHYKDKILLTESFRENLKDEIEKNFADIHQFQHLARICKAENYGGQLEKMGKNFETLQHELVQLFANSSKTGVKPSSHINKLVESLSIEPYGPKNRLSLGLYYYGQRLFEKNYSRKAR